MTSPEPQKTINENKCEHGYAIQMFSVPPGKQKDIFKYGSNLINNAPKKDTRITFLPFGMFDYIEILFSQRSKRLQEFASQNTPAYIHEGRFHSGNLLSNVTPEAMKNDILGKPFAAFTFINIHNDVSPDSIPIYIDRAVNNEEFKLSEKNISYYLLDSYGIEDCILLSAGESIHDIISFVFQLRERPILLTSSEETRHIVQESSTIICMPIKNTDEWENDIQDIRNRISKQASNKKLSYHFHLMAKPGYLAYLKEAIPSINDFRFELAIGDEDYRLIPNNPDHLTEKHFIDYFCGKLIPWVASDQTNTLLETVTKLSLEEKITDNEKVSFPEKFKEEEDRLCFGGHEMKLLFRQWELPEHIENSLIKLNDLVLFIEDKPFLKRDFSYIFDCWNKFCLFIVNAKDIRQEYMKKLFTDKNMKIIISYFYDAIAQRLRALYPGVSSSEIPVEGFQGSYQKFLLSIDTLANEILINVNIALKQVFPLEDRKTDLLSNVLISKFGFEHIPHVFTVDYMDISFLSIPSSLVFDACDTWYILHEIGHVVLSTLMNKLKEKVMKINAELSDKKLFMNVDENVSEDERKSISEDRNKINDFTTWEELRDSDNNYVTLFDELFADYFLTTLCFSGSSELFAKHCDGLFKNFKLDSFESARKEVDDRKRFQKDMEEVVEAKNMPLLFSKIVYYMPNEVLDMFRKPWVFEWYKEVSELPGKLNCGGLNIIKEFIQNTTYLDHDSIEFEIKQRDMISKLMKYSFEKDFSNKHSSSYEKEQN